MTARLRAEVRDFLRAQVDAGRFVPGVDGWHTGHDPEFSRALAARGWVGMTIPVEYGGHGRTFVERFAVTEELLAAGAPVAAHWVADRQAAPSLLRYGTEKQKHRFLPGIARGETSWAIGMSEPDTGSDLASVRTKAVPTEDGWRLTGIKLWTTGAHHAHAFFVLARSAPRDPADRHAGLSQFIVPLDSPGIEIRPVPHLTGEHHFNEVRLDDVFVPENLVLGTVGDGWPQVTAELGFERSGPERFLSTFRLLAGLAGTTRDRGLGELTGRIFGLHHLSRRVSESLARGEDAHLAAALVKVLGTETEGDIVELADQLTAAGGELADLVRSGLMLRPAFTLRGGTNEILRGVIARESGRR